MSSQNRILDLLCAARLSLDRILIPNISEVGLYTEQYLKQFLARDFMKMT